ncbi:hypothetical protein ACHAPS_005128 [Verticillium nonalfalfae]
MDCHAVKHLCHSSCRGYLNPCFEKSPVDIEQCYRYLIGSRDGLGVDTFQYYWGSDGFKFRDSRRDGDHTDCASVTFQLNRGDHAGVTNWYTTVVSTGELVISSWPPQHHDSLGTGIPDCERSSQPVQWHLGRSQQWRGGGRLILTQWLRTNA